MAQDIMLDLVRMRQLHDGLMIVINEFEAAGRTNDSLEDAIDLPDDRSSLRDKAHDFEAAWNDKRGKLEENLDGIQESLRGIVDAWSDWDAETAADIESQSEPTTLAGIE